MKYVVLAAMVLFLQGASAVAQPWTPAPRHLSLSLDYQYADAGQHLASGEVPPEFGGDGDKTWDLGTIQGQTVMISCDYGILPRLAASFSTAYVASTYDGIYPDGEIDDGRWNQSFQDLSFGLRYVAVQAPVTITPGVQLTVPSHDYEVLGHSAVGRGLNELRLGSSFGWIPRGRLLGFFAQAGYGYTIAESLLDVRPNRSDASLSLGYFITQKLTAWTGASYAFVHEGIDWLTDPEADPNNAHFHVHDQLAKKVATVVGGGLSYNLGAVSLGGSVYKTVAGENTHDALTVGISLSRGIDLSR